MENIGFIGTGNMGKALIEGIVKRGIFSPNRVLGYDIITAKAENLAREFGIRASKSMEELMAESSTVVIAVKPQNMEETLLQMKAYLHGRPLIISIAAGITLEFIEGKLQRELPIIRAMPNTPALVLQGATALAKNRYASEEDMKKALSIFSAVGTAIEVDEKLMDAVTGLSGSGPAYFLLFLEALVDAGVLCGIPRNIAKELIIQTGLGTIEMVKNSKLHFGELKDMVTSPGGTTIYGLKIMDRAGLRGIVMEAVKRAVERASELQKNLKN